MFPAHEAGYSTRFEKLESGVRIRVVEREGATGPAVLLIPGWGSSVYGYRDSLPELAQKGLRPIAVDLKGMGLSDKPLGVDEYTSDALIAHIHEIIRALRLEKPALVGHSLAGSLVYRYCRRHPDSACAAVMLAPVGHIGLKLLWLFKAVTGNLPRRCLPLLSNRAFVRASLARGYGRLRPFTDEDVEEYAAPTQFPEFAIAQRDMLHAYNWREPVEGPLEVPLMLISGTEDPFVGKRGVDAFKKKIPDIRVVEIAGAGHILPEEAPHEVNSAIVEFLRLYCG
jgi:pimeloyl-ACP methyl ester carboxylesterase